MELADLDFQETNPVMELKSVNTATLRYVLKCSSMDLIRNQDVKADLQVVQTSIQKYVRNKKGNCSGRECNKGFQCYPVHNLL